MDAMVGTSINNRASIIVIMPSSGSWPARRKQDSSVDLGMDPQIAPVSCHAMPVR
ncbi:hypothetical protein ZHAS_00019251 [Anopheles sinensis]|uniref:Uncharacterized protein n=1 Tax=Anopheles sinensis TaxID=74873 RepID=A0A084WL09_ANOSI|nr:hypothetical protein ZHAS_00019251 [Anopheles sinensis]